MIKILSRIRSAFLSFKCPELITFNDYILKLLLAKDCIAILDTQIIDNKLLPRIQVLSYKDSISVRRHLSLWPANNAKI